MSEGRPMMDLSKIKRTTTAKQNPTATPFQDVSWSDQLAEMESQQKKKDAQRGGTNVPRKPTQVPMPEKLKKTTKKKTTETELRIRIDSERYPEVAEWLEAQDDKRISLMALIMDAIDDKGMTDYIFGSRKRKTETKAEPTYTERTPETVEPVRETKTPVHERRTTSGGVKVDEDGFVDPEDFFK